MATPPHDGENQPNQPPCNGQNNPSPCNPNQPNQPINNGFGNCAVTNETGNYQIKGLFMGEYVVQFHPNKADYVGEFYNNTSTWEEAMRIKVTANQTTTDINAALATNSHLSGRVTNADGQPLAGIIVEVYGSKGFQNEGHMAKTNQDGYYDIALRNGEYRVGFFDWSGKYLPEFYNDAFTLETAAIVTVVAEQNTAQIDAVLSTSGSISGQVTTETGSPLKAVLVELYQSKGDKWVQLRGSFTDGEGKYELNRLANGTYRLHFVPLHNYKPNDQAISYASEYYNDAVDLATATDVVIANGQTLSDLNVKLSEGGYISGQVTNIEGQAVERVKVVVFQQAGDKWVVVSESVTDKAGQYKVTGLNNATYRLGFFDKPGRYAYEFYDDVATVEQAKDVIVKVGTDSKVDVVLAKATPSLIEVKPGGGRVETDPRTGEVVIVQRLHHLNDVIINKENVCANGQKPNGEVILKMSTISKTQTYPMNEQPAGSGRYQAIIPAQDLLDGALLTMVADCGTQKVGQVEIRKYDPSGIISDAQTEQPIANATVTLYKVPGWQARLSASDNSANSCESNLSKDKNSAWSQTAPTDLGVLADPAANEIDPLVNPLSTEADGSYGWEVTAGCWYVVVEAAGYTSLTSPVVGVPPAVTDLDLALTPISPNKDSVMIKVYLPIVLR